jgi:hypothetical protein
MEKLIKGTIFYNKNMPGCKTKVIDIDDLGDSLDVEITNKEGIHWNESWRLQHTLWAFERDEYYFLVELIKYSRSNFDEYTQNLLHCSKH